MRFTLTVVSIDDQDQAHKILKAVAEILKLQGHNVCLEAEHLKET